MARQEKAGLHDGWFQQKKREKKERIRLADVDGLVEKYSEKRLEIVG